MSLNSSLLQESAFLDPISSSLIGEFACVWSDCYPIVPTATCFYFPDYLRAMLYEFFAILYRSATLM